MSWWPQYEARPRLAVEDGVKARKAGKGFATRWWARKWLEALERIAGSSRLARGRSYARSGQVMDYRVEAGGVTAKVQGSRQKPYEIRLSLRAFSGPEWAAALEALASQAGFAAELLAGRMPEDVESAFQAAGVSLMPVKSADLKTSCSCPDYANPCKHIAAVHYLLAEAFDDDPFLLFQLRGRGREEVLGELARLWGGPEEAPVAACEPLPANPLEFWGKPISLPPLDFAEPPLWGAHLLAFGPPGPWAGPGELREALEPALREAGRRAREAMDGEAGVPVPVERRVVGSGVKPGRAAGRRPGARPSPGRVDGPAPAPSPVRPDGPAPAPSPGRVDGPAPVPGPVRPAGRRPEAVPARVVGAGLEAALVGGAGPAPAPSGVAAAEAAPVGVASSEAAPVRQAGSELAPVPARLAAPALLHWHGDSAVLIHLPAGPLQRFGPKRRLALKAWLNCLPEILSMRPEEEVRAAFPTLAIPVRRLDVPSLTVEGTRVRGASVDEALELLTGVRLESSPGLAALASEGVALHQLWRYRALHGYLPVLRRGQTRRCREEDSGEPDAALREMVGRAIDSLSALLLLVDPPDPIPLREVVQPPIPPGLPTPLVRRLRQAETLRLPDFLAEAAEFQPLHLDDDGFSGVWLEDGEDADYHFMEVLDARVSS